MRVSEEKKQQKIRRTASEALLVYDLATGHPMGQIIDMSAKGMRLMNEKPTKVHQIYYCRLPLEQEIEGSIEVFFDAECRWSKLNEKTGWFDSGFILRYPSQKDADIVKALLHGWMVDRLSGKDSRYKQEKSNKIGIMHRLFTTPIWKLF